MTNFCIKTYIAFCSELAKLRDNEDGMELVQALFLILMVVIIAAVLWTFLSDMITDLLDRIAAGGESS
ncbi:MAG: hypothetical protein FWG65_11680 [Turicibacter sp.]|nr:hypothetical protein [Turicibacter sp.]